MRLECEATLYRGGRSGRREMNLFRFDVRVPRGPNVSGLDLRVLGVLGGGAFAWT